MLLELVAEKVAFRLLAVQVAKRQRVEICSRLPLNPGVGQRPLVYAEAGARHALHQYNYHFWADTPPRMAQELTVDMLRAAQVAEPVVTPEVRIRADYELTGKIKLLEHIRGERSSVIVMTPVSAC